MLIQDIYELDIFIDDLNIFGANGVTFQSASIYEAIMNPIPTCSLTLTIPMGWMDNRSLVDGTKIRFTLKNKIFNIDNSYDFRLFNINHLELYQSFLTVTLDGVMDFFAGYSHANTYNMFSSSADVFRAIASAHGLMNEIDNTNDVQLWIAGENNIYKYLNLLAQYGWVNETSGMFWCLDRHKILLYKNLSGLFRERQEKIWTFIQTSKPNIKNKEYAYSKARASLQSGTNNLKNEGYGGTDTYFDLLSYSWKDVAARKVIAESNLINISKELSQGLAQEWYPFNVGNFHPNYELALKQNRRVLSTYSTYITLTCEYFQPYRIGQIVNYDYLDAQDINNKIKSLSGVYCITANQIKFSLSSVSSVLELVMQGFNGIPLTQEVY